MTENTEQHSWNRSTANYKLRDRISTRSGEDLPFLLLNAEIPLIPYLTLFIGSGLVSWTSGGELTPRWVCYSSLLGMPWITNSFPLLVRWVCNRFILKKLFCTKYLDIASPTIIWSQQCTIAMAHNGWQKVKKKLKWRIDNINVHNVRKVLPPPEPSFQLAHENLHLSETKLGLQSCQ